ncbi:MAG: heterodisulfide reductase-related iron-sulfur binding cluster [bacterium]
MFANPTVSVNGIAFSCIRSVPKMRPDFFRQIGLRLLPVTCIGQVGAGRIIQAFLSGAKWVILIGCADDNCRHENGPQTARGQVELSRRLFELLGLGKERVVYLSTVSESAVERELKEALAGSKSDHRDSRFDTNGDRSIMTTESGQFGPQNFVCLDCGRCSGVCPVARTGFGFSPRRLIKQALDGNEEMPTRTLYACLGCDLCATVCPSGKSISQTVLKLRAVAFSKGANPVLAHSGLMQMLSQIMAKGDGRQNRLGWLNSGLKVTDKGETALFTGCLPYFDVIFADFGLKPLSSLRNAVRIMNSVGVEPVVLEDERCCGRDLLWLGDVGTAANLLRHNIEQLKQAGVKRVVFLCPECLHTFKAYYPGLVGQTGLEFVHISQFLAASGFMVKERVKRQRRIVTYHDPCWLGRKQGIYTPPRQLIATMPDLELREMRHSRDQGLCCGGTSWLECGAAVKLLQERRLAEVKEVSADTLVTACTKCEIHLHCALARNADSDLKIINLVDLLNEET